MPKVSVITGYYNRGHAIEATICSILSQTLHDLELIVFDDASTDDTASRLYALKAKLADSRLKLRIHDRNLGFTKGMIAAIAESNAEYIAVQGSGDISMPERIAKQVAHLDAHPDVGAVGCWYTNVVEHTGVRRPRRPNASGIDFDQLLRGNVFSHGEVMFRRSTYDLVDGYREAFQNCQDYDLWLRMVQVSSLATIPEFLYERYVRFDGVSYDPQKFAVQARYFLLCQRIAVSETTEQRDLLTRLEQQGPLSMIDDADPDLQARYFKAALRSIVWGGIDQATAIAGENILAPHKRWGIQALASCLSTPVGTPVLRLVRRALGVASV